MSEEFIEVGYGEALQFGVSQGVYYKDQKQVVESLRQQLAAMTTERDKAKAMPMRYRRMEFNAQLQDENESLRQQLAASQAHNVTLRGYLEKIAFSRTGKCTDLAQELFNREGWAAEAIADLDGLIMCHAKPTVETLSVVTNTGYVYVRAIDRKVEPNTKLFSAWEPK